MRDIPSGLLTALSGDHIRPFYAMELLFDTAPLRLWNGIGSKTINVQGADETFNGFGERLRVGNPE